MTASTTFVLRSAFASLAGMLSATTLMGCGDAATASVTPAPTSSANHAPTQPEAITNCLRDAERNLDAFMKRDVEGMIAFMHPSAASLSRDPAQFRASVRKTFDQFDEDGVTLERPILTPPTEVFTGGARHFAVVGESMTFATGPMKITAKSYLLGISEDEGRSWKFVEGTAFKRMSVTKLLPDYPIEHPLPTMPAPKISSALAK